MTALDRAALLELYQRMLTIRRTEEQLVRSYQQGLIYGGCHTYIGEEAVATGVCAHLRNDDFVFGTHRGHGHSIAKGLTPLEVLAELYGRASGASGGRGGSMHLFKPSIGLMGTNGIVGPSITLAAGAAYTFRLLKTNRVAVAFFGDGGINNGAFHEGVNLAGIWDLPVVFVCENNGYATEVPFSTTTKNPSAFDRARAYGVRAERIDGNDVREVWRAAGEAVSRARAGGGPSLLECMTYRLRAHAEGMRDTGYRTKEEVESWRIRDPIVQVRELLVAGGPHGPAVPAGELERIESEVTAKVAAANVAAVEAPYPDPQSVFAHVTADVTASRLEVGHA
jgi:2-oxoisovalerate dehydrogenase E1 component